MTFLLGFFLTVAQELPPDTVQRQSATQQKQSAPEIFLRAEELRLKGNLLEAVSLYREAIKVNPYYIPAHIKMALCYLGLGRYSDALEVIKKAEELDPTDENIKVVKAKILHAMGKDGKAKNILYEILKNNPQNLDARHALAVIFYHSYDYMEAQKLLVENLRYNPNHFWSLITLGRIFQEKRVFSTARNYYEKAIESSPENPWGYVNMALLYLESGDKNLAITFMEKAKSLSPEDPQILNLLSMAYIRAGKLSKSEQVLRKTIEKQGKSSLLLYNLAMTVELQNRNKEAIQLLQEALKLKPEDEVVRVALEELSMAYLEENNPLRKELSSYREKYAEQLAKNGFRKEAAFQFFRAVKLFPQSPLLRRKLAAQLWKTGRYKECLKQLELVQLQEGKSPQLQDTIQTVENRYEKTLDFVLRNYPRAEPIRVFTAFIPRFPYWGHHVGASRWFARLLYWRYLFSSGVVKALYISPKELNNSYESLSKLIQIARENGMEFLILSTVREDGEIFSLTYTFYETSGKPVHTVHPIVLTSRNFLSETTRKAYEDTISKLPFQADVVEVMEDGTIYVNAGTAYGVKAGNSYPILRAGQIVTDPFTGERKGSRYHITEKVQITAAGKYYSIGKVKNINLVEVGDRVKIR